MSIDTDRIATALERIADALERNIGHDHEDDIVHVNYGEIQPEPGREAMLNQLEKNRKKFEMVDLISPSWTIRVPVRKKQ